MIPEIKAVVSLVKFLEEPTDETARDALYACADTENSNFDRFLPELELWLDAGCRSIDLDELEEIGATVISFVERELGPLAPSWEDKE